ncbi:MAG: UDP-N-acetylenolpyruvoylglucosamine reductase [Omnitrophica bacterium RIFCSPLOWO2_01_FULL_45_10]|nr:MAG: UDP-N-acetylenolpyruvoylglucosamine reductase [Omnitrophica bacterium RIFCSPLOWO2_01_FULL_45_10]
MLSGHIDLAEKIKRSCRAKVIIGEPLRKHTTFRIGGSAYIWVEPHGARDLKKILRLAKSMKMPVFVIGNGSNILARDTGFKGIVIRLTALDFRRIEFKKDTVRVGAGYSLARLVLLSCEKGLGGLESLVGIPGTVGGAIYMNAGGQASPMFKNMGDSVTSVKAMDREGATKILKKKKLKFGYRCANLKGYIILEVRLKLKKDDERILRSRCARFLKMKKVKQVLDIPSAGCVFKNPSGFQFTCGQMIDMLGLKGKRIGGAQVSTKHANFIINRGGATATDVLDMIEMIKEKVRENYNIELELEIEVV